ncbi:CaiB/BaiF CoA transferase family protein, partial [Streptomyces sp. NPDC127084]|uniref:CaiB/BaiF CoA transferase family protein n=1 Tax=Streptomyces sp. NPDC127084 TaxID=3347133 RepID=UPI00364ED678
MLKPMEGVRVLEVAQFTFVPAAGAVLADWGADVIKIEHAEKGDAQRGLVRALGQDVVSKGSSFAPIMDGPNRGKRSIGLSLEKPESQRVLHELIRTSDVFLTNFLPGARARLGIELEDVRAINPDIIYAVGTSFAHSGPEADKGGYDGTAFWARAGCADSVTPDGSDRVVNQPCGAYGDNIGGMTIAGGIAAALFAKSRTGVASTVDISLLGVGAWAAQLNVNLALMAGGPLPKPDPTDGRVSNPLSGTHRTADGRWLSLIMLQPGRYWRDFCEKVDRPELAEDPRFDSAEKLMANAGEAAAIVADIIASRTKDEWVVAFKDIEGQWAVVQNTYEVGHDPALRNVGQIADVVDAHGVSPPN